MLCNSENPDVMQICAIVAYVPKLEFHCTYVEVHYLIISSLFLRAPKTSNASVPVMSGASWFRMSISLHSIQLHGWLHEVATASHCQLPACHVALPLIAQYLSRSARPLSLMPSSAYPIQRCRHPILYRSVCTTLFGFSYRPRRYIHLVFVTRFAFLFPIGSDDALARNFGGCARSFYQLLRE